MVYTVDLDYAKHRGYTTYAAYLGDNPTPTDVAIDEIRNDANVLVNVAFHGVETDATVYTVLLATYEMIVMDRLINYAYLIDNLKEIPENYKFIKEVEFQMLRDLGGQSKITSVSMYDKTSPFQYSGGILY